MNEPRALTTIPDDELLHRLAELLQNSRCTESDLVAHIGEVDRRRLYAREASPSMFAYCTQVLHLSGAEAYLRIAAARAAREHPVLLAMLADGRLHLSGIAKLAPHLTLENREAILSRATHRTKRQIEELIAEIHPRPDVPSLMRKLPGSLRREPVVPPALVPARSEDGLAAGAAELGVAARAEVFELPRAGLSPVGASPRAASAGAETKAAQPELGPDGVCAATATPDQRGEATLLWERREIKLDQAGPFEPAGAHRPRSQELSSPSSRSVVEPIAPSRYKVQFTASQELHDKLERLQALLRADVPDGDLGAVIDRAVTETLQRLEARRYARTAAPRRTTTARAGASLPSTTPPHGAPGLSRHIPATLRRAVYERDGGRCRYVDAGGRRCSEDKRLEYHHRHPFGMGGGHTLDSVRLMCRTHNLYLAEHDYGLRAMAPYRRPSQEVAGPPAGKA